MTNINKTAWENYEILKKLTGRNEEEMRQYFGWVSCSTKQGKLSRNGKWSIAELRQLKKLLRGADVMDFFEKKLTYTLN